MANEIRAQAAPAAKAAQSAFTAVDVASWFLQQVDRDSGESITHLKLQKLVFYADAWSLALKGRELVCEPFQAWAHGPVAPSLWTQLSGNGWRALASDVVTSNAEFDDDALEVLQQVQDAYGPLQAKALETMTHQEDPWLEARGPLPLEASSNACISKDTTARFYQELYESVNGEAEQQVQ